MAPASPREECLQAFRQFDADGDGLITREELSTVFRAIDADHWNDHRLKLLMDAADTNRDGFIEYEEFVNWLLSDKPEWAPDRAAARMQRRVSINRPALLIDWRKAVTRQDNLVLQVDQSYGRTLGVKVDSSDGRTLLIREIKKDGLIAAFNSKTRSEKISVGDRIVEINDLHGDARRLMKELKKRLPMDLVIMPSEESKSYVHKIADHFELAPTWLEAGHFSCVRRGTHRDTQAVYAVQSLHKKRTTEQEFEDMIGILKDMDHHNIIKVFEVFEDCLDFHLVSELCSGGELFERVLRDNSFTERQGASVTAQILAGVGYLHSRSICHRSIRPEHVLLEAEKPMHQSVIKIIDFRTAVRFKEGEIFDQPLGQILYMPPEMAGGRAYDYTCDIWSCGVMLYLLLSGYPPFAGENDTETMRLVQGGELIFPEGDWKTISELVRDLIRSLLAFERGSRPSASEAAKHPWFKSSAPEEKPFPLHKCQRKMKAFCGQSKLKKAALHEVARRCKTDEIEKLAETFALLDTNNDHLITFIELKEGLDKLGTRLSLEELTALMEGMDLDGSRQIDYSEFLAATLDRIQSLESQTLFAAFQVFDRDRSGTISSSELHKVLYSDEMQGLVTEAEIQRILAEFDTDNNGSIDFQEFMEMMNREAPLSEVKEL